MDLREEFNNLVSIKEGIGRWVLVRHFSTVHSSFWKPEVSEAIGGPAYEYTDTLVESYSAPLGATNIRFSGLKENEYGVTNDDIDKYYFNYSVEIKENDEIFDLDYCEQEKPIVVFNQSEVDLTKRKVLPLTRLKVKTIHLNRGNQGRVEYKTAMCYKIITR